MELGWRRTSFSSSSLAENVRRSHGKQRATPVDTAWNTNLIWYSKWPRHHLTTVVNSLASFQPCGFHHDLGNRVATPTYSPAFLAAFLSQATSVGDIVRWYPNRRFIGILSHLTLPVSLVPSPEVLVRCLHCRLYIEASVPAWISVLYTEITDRILQSIHYSFANRFTSDA